MRSRLPILVMFIALLFTALTQAKLETMELVMPGVWFRQGDLDRFGHCNNIVIEMKEYLIVVDANFPSGARALMADIKKVSAKPVKYVFDTHHHGDHAYGNPVWTRAGATTIAFQAVAGEMKRFEPARWKADTANRKDVGELNLPTAEPPRETFSKSPHVIDDGTRRVEFHHFGWAHTRGDGFAYLPKEQVLCTGDAVVNGPFNGYGDGWAANWPKVVARARKLKVKHVLPAHGPAGGPEILAGQEQYVRELYDRVKRAVRTGGKMPEASDLPAAVKNWTGPWTKDQVKDIREEIVQGKPRGELVVK
ncbi:MAG: MBL fold metallo-hydrolase [Bryobacteraceae bacterium]